MCCAQNPVRVCVLCAQCARDTCWLANVHACVLFVEVCMRLLCLLMRARAHKCLMCLCARNARKRGVLAYTRVSVFVLCLRTRARTVLCLQTRLCCGGVDARACCAWKCESMQVMCLQMRACTWVVRNARTRCVLATEHVHPCGALADFCFYG